MIASEKPLHIDIPVKLADVKMVFSIGALQFEGDLPASIFHMQLIENDIANWDAKSEIIAVFHTNAGHVTLHDRPTTPTATSRPAMSISTAVDMKKADGATIALTVNGCVRHLDLDLRASLLDTLRDNLDLTGTKKAAITASAAVGLRSDSLGG